MPAGYFRHTTPSLKPRFTMSAHFSIDTIGTNYVHRHTITDQDRL